MKKLPELLKFNDGNPVLTTRDFELRRREIIDILTKECYGSLIPTPESLYIREIGNILNFGVDLKLRGTTYDIIMPRITLRFVLLRPTEKVYEKSPVVICGDFCWHYVTADVVEYITKNGITLVLFDRLDLVPDAGSARDYGLYNVYPELDFGALMAWAWGYSRVIDALNLLEEELDLSKIAITGHSRGGKASLLAGALDERIWLTNANNSGIGGAGTFNYPDDGGERCGDIWANFPYWFSPNLQKYIGKEGEIPFDAHFLKALVAPRLLLTTEGNGDTWASPKATKLTHEVTYVAFELFGVRENNVVSFREGRHGHFLEDFVTLTDFITASIKAGK